MTFPPGIPTRVLQTVEQFRARPVPDAQVNPLADTDTTLLTVAAGYWYEGRIYVAEQGGATPTYRIAVRLDGEALAAKHYLVYGRQLAANSSEYVDLVYLPEDAIVTVRASTTGVSFTFSGLKRRLDVDEDF